MTTTYCRICEAACGLIVDVDAAGRPSGLRPDPDHPTSAGYVCKKGVRFVEVASHPERLLRPRQRDADVPWDAALDDVARRLRTILEAHGPDAVALYTGNPLGFSFLGTLAAQRFAQSLGTRNVFSAGSQDANNKFAAGQLMHGSPLLAPIPDLEHADLAVMFGTNPAISQSSFVHLAGGTRVFDAMVARGAKVVWVDPRRTESARRWGEHLPIRAGTDIALLLALLHRFRDACPEPRGAVEGLDRLLAVAARFPIDRAAAITGIPAAQIEALAERIAASPTTTFHLSTGVNMGGFGTLAVVALQALAWLTGNLDRRGGLVFAPLAAPFARLARSLGVGKAQRPSRIGGFSPTIDTLPAAVLADEILTPGEGRIRALVVIAGDPLLSIPGEGRLREALSSLDLLVTIDLFQNATGRLAHWCLPAASWLERWDVATTTIPLQTAPLVQWAGPVAPPPGEARTEAWIIGSLLQRLGHRAAGAMLRLPYDRWLPSRGYGVRTGSVKPGSYLGRGPLTPGNRVRFWDPVLDAEARRLEETEFGDGFLLIGRRQKLAHNSWLKGGVRTESAVPTAYLAAEDLRRIGVDGGGRIEIGTSAGTAVLDAVPEAGMSPGTVCIPHGLEALNVNALIPSGVAAVEPASGQHRMTAVSVEVRAG